MIEAEASGVLRHAMHMRLSGLKLQVEALSAECATASVQNENAPDLRDRPTAEADETVPLQDETVPLQDETVPLQDETLPLQDETLPLQDETLPLQARESLGASLRSSPIALAPAPSVATTTARTVQLGANEL